MLSLQCSNRHALRYVQSMESQQTRLIKALQRVHRDVRQSIKEEDMNEIVQIVQACGFDFESVPDMPASHMGNSKLHAKPKGIETETPFNVTPLKKGAGKKITGEKQRAADNTHETGQIAKKRKRGKPDGLVQTAAAENSNTHREAVQEGQPTIQSGYSDGAHDPETSPLKRPKSFASTGLTDDCWNLSNQWDQILAPNTVFDPETLLAEPPPYQPILPNSEYASHATAQSEPSAPIWGLNDSPQSTNSSDSSCRHLTNGSSESDSTVEGAEPSASNILEGFDWESTLWWDPSMIYGMDTENLGLEVDGLASSLL